MKKIILLLAKKYILSYIRDNKEKIVEFINAKIDIPKMTEKEEKKQIESLYQIVYEVIQTII